MYYINQETGEKTPLNQVESNVFLDMIDATCGEKEDDNQFIEDALKVYPHLVFAFDENGNTVLHHALGRDNVLASSCLVKYGASYLAKNNKGSIPLGYIQQVEDPSLKQALCEAVGVGTIADLETLLDQILDQEVEEKLEREVTAEVLARKAAEAEAKERALIQAEKDAAYAAARTFQEKVAIDPLRAMQEHAQDQRAISTKQVIGEILAKPASSEQPKGKCTIMTALDAEQQNPEAVAAIEVLQSKKEPVMLPVNAELEGLLAEMFGEPKHSLDDLIGTKASYALEAGNRSFFASFGQWIEILSDSLSAMLNMEIDSSLVEATVLQLQGLLTLAGSGHLPIGAPHRFNPDDDFEPSFGGGNSGVVFAEVPQGDAPLQLLGITHNGTAIYIKVSNSADDA